MYIKRLESWDEKKWKKYFLQFPKIKTDQEKQEIKQALTLSSKEAVESFFPLFRKYGIINGIWPGYMGAFFRGIISQVFKWVRYEWHDIEFGIFGSEYDFHHANYGLLKYSLETIARNFRTIMKLELNIVFKTSLILLFYIYSVVMYWIAGFCYIMVELFGRSAFSFE